MKKVAVPLLLFLSAWVFYSCGQKNILSPQEAKLIEKMNFDLTLLSLLKVSAKGELKQLPAVEQETGELLDDAYFEGVCFESKNKEEVAGLVRELKPECKKLGYLIFMFEGNDSSDVAVIKGTDELDILKYRRTDGINYDLDSEDVLKKITEWKVKYGLSVIGCSRDWVHLEFENMPSDLQGFAKEVYAFCPDSVDQGVGSLEELQRAIREMKGVWLWWD